MKIAEINLVDKNYQFRPYDLKSTIVARIEIVCNTEAQLQAILDHLHGLNLESIMSPAVAKQQPMTLMEKKYLEGFSGVHPPPKVAEVASTQAESIDPISSLELD